MRGSAIVTRVPLASLDALGAAGKMFDGQLSAVATLGGTLSDLTGQADLELGPVRLGPASLPPSRATLTIEPSGQPTREAGRTICGNPRAGGFDRAEYDRDLPDGALRVDGELFDGQVVLDGIAILTIVALNGVIGFFQEFRAQNAVLAHTWSSGRIAR